MKLNQSDKLQLVIGTYNRMRGWNGYSFMQAGYIYQPYIPLYITPIQMTAIDFDKLQLVIGRKL